MNRITTVEDELVARLQIDTTEFPRLSMMRKRSDGTQVDVPVKVEGYPAKLSVDYLKRLGQSGAVLVRYAGSKYGPRAGVEQTRRMHFELVAVSESLREESGHLGCHEIMEGAADRVIGYKPVNCTDGCTLLHDSFIDLAEGVWQYGVLIEVPTTRVQQLTDESEFGPLLKEVTTFINQ